MALLVSGRDPISLELRNEVLVRRPVITCSEAKHFWGVLFLKAALSGCLVSSGMFRLGYSLWKHRLRIEELALHWVRNVYTRGRTPLLGQQDFLPLYAHYFNISVFTSCVPGMTASTRDSLCWCTTYSPVWGVRQYTNIFTSWGVLEVKWEPSVGGK